MDQAAAGLASNGGTIASVLQQWTQRTSARNAKGVPLSSFDVKRENGISVEAKEVPSTRGSDSVESKHHLDPALKKWPQHPLPITNEPVVERFLDLFDVILCLLPVLLIIKAGLCVLAAHWDVKNKGAYLDQATQLSVRLIQFNDQLTTLFTIIFILIVSITVRRYALWKAERGATIGELEQLHASISLPATLKAIWSLRAFTLTSLGLIFVWAWYYVGSQSSPREYSYQDSNALRQVDVAFLGPQAKSPFLDGTIDTLSPVRKTDMTARYHMYNQFTAGTQQNDTQDAKTINGADIYGATLTPWYGPRREQTWADMEFDSEGWLEIKSMSSQPVVSSIGTSLYRRETTPGDNSTLAMNKWYPSKMIGKYTYQTSHFQANCTAPVLSNATRPEGALAIISTAMNMTRQNSSDSTVPRQLYFWHYVNSNSTLTATCDMTYVTVEIEAHCTAATCKPSRMRHINTTPRTALDDDNFASSFFNSMMIACGIPLRPGDYSTFDNDNGLVAVRNEIKLGKLSSDDALSQALAAAQFPLSMSITRFMNTYFTSSQVLLHEHDFQDALAINGSIQLNSNPDFTFLQMKGAKFEPQYRLSWPWLIVDIISNVVLLTSMIVAFWLRKHTLAPDIFGFVSSLTRDNPDLNLPLGGSTLSGIERSRAMKHVKVKIGDVGTAESMSSGGDVGRVGLTCVDTPLASPRLRDLEKGRIYH